jgi:hypothetical protein
MENNTALMKIEKYDNPLIRLYESGFHSVLIEGNFRDYIVDNHQIYYKPFFVYNNLTEKGFHTIIFSKSAGLHYYNAQGGEVPSEVTRVLARYNLKLNSIPQDNEISSSFRSFQQLLLTKHEKIKFALVIEYTEHVSPCFQTAAGASEESIIVTETMHSLSLNPLMKKSGNLLICSVGRDDLHNNLLNELYRYSFPFPTENETRNFIDIILDKCKSSDSIYAGLNDSVSPLEFGRLIKGLRLMDVENIFKEAKRNRVLVDRNLILKCKSESISKISENTLEFQSTELTFNDLVGMDVAKSVLKRFALQLKNMSPLSPRGILCLGPAGTGKTTLATIFAKEAGFNIVQLKEVENQFVGESQRKMRLALQLIESLAPCVLYIDEIELIVSERSATRHDGGVKSDLMAQLFQFTSREDLRGKVVLLASSNLGYKLDFALLDRFSAILPIFELTATELTQLFPVMEKRITGKTTLDTGNKHLIESGKVLSAKGASPRRIYDIINHANFLGGISPENILRASISFQGNAKPITTAYTTLTALSIVTQAEFFPWSENPSNYQYQWYLDDIVDKNTGQLNRELLEQKINEYGKNVTH